MSLDVVGEILQARRVALIGASDGKRDWWSFGARMTRSILASSFDEVVLVSRASHIDGHATVPSLAEYRGEPGDLCVVVISPRQLVSVMDEAVALGWRTFLVVTGQLGAQERAYLAAQPERGVRVWGPNCVGLIDTVRSKSLLASNAWPTVVPGRPRIAIVSQSGGALGSIASAIAKNGLTVGHLMSVGEEADIGVDDVLVHFSEAAEADGVVLFLEAARRPSRFLDALERVTASGIPVVIVKVGRTERSREVAQGHSGALVGPWHDFYAAARARGAIVTDSLRDAAGAIAVATMLREDGQLGRRVSIITSSGGSGALAVDLADEYGLELAPFSELGSERLARHLGGEQLSQNPLDTADGGGTPATLPVYLEVLATESDIDVSFFIHGGALYSETLVGIIMEKHLVKPMIAAWPDLPDAERDRCLDRSILVVDDIKEALRWLDLAATDPRSNNRALECDDDINEKLATAHCLTYEEAVTMAEGASLPFVDHLIVSSADELSRSRHPDGPPWVVKGGNLRSHKARHGGVAVGVETDDLEEMVDQMASRFGTAVVERQLQPGLDLMISVHAGAFGGFVSVGLGGNLADHFGNLLIVSLDDARDSITDRLNDSSLAGVIRSAVGQANTEDVTCSIALLVARAVAVLESNAAAVVELNPVRVTAGEVLACDVKIARVARPEEGKLKDEP